MAVIKETKDYQVITFTNDDDDRLYGVYNKKYDVMEAETTLLPRAFGYLVQLQAGLDAESDGAFDMQPNDSGIGLKLS